MPLKQSTSGRTTATKSNRQHIDSTRLEAVYDDIKNSLDQFDVLELRRLIGQGMVTNIALRNAVDFQHEPVETLLVGPKLPCPTIPRSIVESERLSAEESDRIARAIDVFENKGVAAAWMQLPHVASRCTSNVLADLHFDDAKELTTKAALALTSRIASPVETDATLTAAHFRPGHANEIMSFFPHAAAYLRSVENDGECFSLDSEASSLDTADVVVPIRSATCACVKPAPLRAASRTIYPPMPRCTRSTQKKSRCHHKRQRPHPANHTIHRLPDTPAYC